MRRPVIRAATRSSLLARWQTAFVAARLASVGIIVEDLLVETLGDRTQAANVPLHSIGGQGVFVKEVQAAVQEGRADIAVHSAKDLPAVTPDGLVLACVPERGEVRDMLIGSTFDALRPGAVIGTGSVRRRAQLRHMRADLVFAEVRGNVGTRLAKAVNFDAIVLAHVALERLSLLDGLVGEIVSTELMLPMVAQGAIAVECRADDAATLAALAEIDDTVAHAAIDCERAYLRRLGGGCELPVGALASVHGRSINLDALVAAPDGSTIVRRSGTSSVDERDALGRRLAEEILAAGGAALLAVEID
jgi:hydroxymethylbilane synthase